MEFAALVGIDWADQKHNWSMRTADGKLHRGELKHSPEAIQVWVAELQQRFGERPVGIALEQSRGSLVAMLSKYAHLVLFPLHSKTLMNYREAFTPSGAKSDPRDADLALEVLVMHRDKLRPLQPDTEETRKLQFLTEQRRELVNRQTSEKQVLISWLKQMFPQMLEWFDDVGSQSVRDLLLKWPTLQSLQKASPKSLRNFFSRHRGGSAEETEQRMAQIRGAVPATHDPALLQAGVLVLQTTVRLLIELRTSIAEFDRAIEETYRSHPDRAIVESFPGAGPALEPRLIAAVGTQRDRFASADNLAMYVGIAPVQEASGKQKWIHWRWACPKFIRQTFHEWAGCSIRTCDWAREHYEGQRAKGKGHHAAVRSVAFKWIRIFFRCWRDRTPYCEEIYLKARQARQPQPQPAPSSSCGKPVEGLPSSPTLPLDKTTQSI
jgi:transposase